MNKGKFQPGQSGNPAGRPPKSRALADLLNRALSKTIDTPDGRVSRKRLLASLVAEAVTTARVQFPGDEKPSFLTAKDWVEFVKWAYQYLDPSVSRSELTGKDGGPIAVSMSWADFIKIDEADHD